MQRVNTIFDVKFSLMLGGATSIIPYEYINVRELLGIYGNQAMRTIAEQLTFCQGEEYKAIKAQLPYITPYGTFLSRANTNILSYNTNILAIDIDRIEVKDISNLFNTIAKAPGIILAYISSSGKGIKALIHVKYTTAKEPIKEHHLLLKQNVKLIGEAIGLGAYSYTIDTAQFVLSQPFYLNYSPQHYIHYNPKPLILDMQPLIKPIIKPVVIAPTRASKDIIERTIYKQLEYIAQDLNPNKERHAQIAKFKRLANIMHYAPHLTETIKAKGYELVIMLYGSESEANKANAKASYLAAWSNYGQDRIIEYL